jgi:PAS domain S-box-containing protein
MNLLIVDDDPTSLKLLRAQLESEGHAVFEAYDGVEALALLEHQRVDAVISDVLMPRMDGYRLCYEIRKHARLHDLPIIIYTSTYTSLDDEKLALDVGADKYLKKPVSLETIIAALHEVTAMPHAARHPKALQEIELPKEYSEKLVSKLKERNAELMAAENKFRTLVEQSIVGIYIIQDDQFVYVNPRMAEIFGRSEEEMTSRTLYDFMVPEDHALARENIRKRISGGVPSVHYCLRVLHQSGAVLQAEIHGSRANYNGRPAVMGTLLDITERKQAEAVIKHANRALAALSAVNRNMVRATDENELLKAICQAIVEQRGYRMAWVGYVQQDAGKSIKIMTHADHDEEEGYLETLQLTWADTERGMGPSARAIRSGTTQLCQDIANDPQYSPWRDEALKLGYAANIALPLMDRSGKVFGILHVYAEEANAFIPTEVDLLEQMAADLAFGVRSLRMRQQRDNALAQNRQQLVQLQDNLEDTVRAIATLVEIRDPYTAGHQVRVAELAVAIAKQMGLPDEQVHAIHIAGVLHDLGKIQIPAEILSKPGKITDIEYSLIKIHPQAGYDILKDIDFPWPIAQMVLQHHERLDGSGYPQGLKGDQIILGARILSVADVVEAMSSHRPYRAGLGVEVALAEISTQRGSHFDPQVVDACLALFHEQHYAFNG